MKRKTKTYTKKALCAEDQVEVDWKTRIRNWNSGIKKRRGKNSAITTLINRLMIPNNCAYCIVYLTPANASLDHAQPLSKKGDDDPKNWRFCCKTCNLSKGSLTEGQFISLLAFLKDLDGGIVRDYILRKLRYAWRVKG